MCNNKHNLTKSQYVQNRKKTWNNWLYLLVIIWTIYDEQKGYLSCDNRSTYDII